MRILTLEIQKILVFSEHYAGKSWAYTFPIPYIGSSLIISRSDEPDKKLFHTYGIGITPGYNFGVQKNTTELIFNQTPK